MKLRVLTIASITFALLVAITVAGNSTSSKSLMPAAGEDLTLWANIQNNSLDALTWSAGTGEATSLFEQLTVIAGLTTMLDSCADPSPTFTVFVPGDQAVQGMFNSLRTSIAELSKSPAIVKGLLDDHIVNGAFSPAQLTSDATSRITARSGYVLTIADDTPEVLGDRVVGTNVTVAGKLITDVQQSCNGYLFGINGFIDSSSIAVHEGLNVSDAVIEPDPLTATWTSPQTPTSSRNLVFQLDFSRPVVSGVSSYLFDNVGTAENCTMVPKAGNPTSPSSTYFLVVTCPGLGTVQPRLFATALEVTNGVGSTDYVDIAETTGPVPVHILNGIVLTIEKTGAGQGTVSSNLSGVQCGVMCVGVFNTRTRITLTPQAQPGSVFVGWSGACLGTARCALTLTASATAVARFEPLTQIIVSGIGAGSGVVTSSFPGVNCAASNGSSCTGWLPSNTASTLQARPNRGFRFLGWMGACVGTGPCSVVTNPAGEVMNVFATFAR